MPTTTDESEAAACWNRSWQAQKEALFWQLVWTFAPYWLFRPLWLWRDVTVRNRAVEKLIWVLGAIIMLRVWGIY